MKCIFDVCAEILVGETKEGFHLVIHAQFFWKPDGTYCVEDA